MNTYTTEFFCMCPNNGIDKRRKTGAYPPPTKESRARLMRQRIEHYQGAERWYSEL